jgi:hypothetical protein
MALELPSIDSRHDFFQVLAEVQTFTRTLLCRSPGEPTLQSIAGQLEAMRRWTADGRTPRLAERRSLDFGPRPAREAAVPTELARFAQRLFQLHDYFADWPSDAPPQASPPAQRVRQAYQRIFRCA